MTKLSNIDAIYLEYPFVNNLILRTKVHDAKVSRLTDEKIETYYPIAYPDLPVEYPEMEYPPNRTNIIGLWLLDRMGNIVTTLGFAMPNRYFDPTNYSQDPFKTKKESLGQAFARIGERKSEVVWAFEAKIGFRFTKRLFSPERCVDFPIERFTLYKLPKGYSSTKDWIEAVASGAAESLREI